MADCSKNHQDGWRNSHKTQTKFCSAVLIVSLFYSKLKRLMNPVILNTFLMSSLSPLRVTVWPCALVFLRMPSKMRSPLEAM